jgi:hypothetical protein
MISNRIKYANQLAGTSDTGQSSDPLVQAAQAVSSGVTTGASAVAKTAKSVVSDAASIASFLGFISSASGVDRMLKVAGGGLLVLLALNQIVKAGTGVNPAQSIGKVIPK